MSLKRLFALVLVYLLTCAAWMVLAGVTVSRTHGQESELREQVSSLWGEPQAQSAPSLRFRAVRPSTKDARESLLITDAEVTKLGLAFPEPKGKMGRQKVTPKNRSASESLAQGSQERWAIRDEAVPVSLDSTRIAAELQSDPRRKGLVWYSLYDVKFDGNFTYSHTAEAAGYLDVEFSLPTQSALYDGLVFEVNGQDQRAVLDPSSGKFSLTLPVQPGDDLSFRAAYESRGAEEWRYFPGGGVQQLEQFQLALRTDFREIDFPGQTLSPTEKQSLDDGWLLNWDFKSTITGHGMGMVLPQHIQPGELSTALIFSAPVSLLFFFIMLFVLATLRELDIHPINYLFLGGAFFAFHLLFSYSADHLTVPWAFGLSSVVSLGLVVSYLRLVVSPLFALREAALGQLIYLIGFSMAHFWEGFTGLTITVLAIVTLFVLMQATGRLRWTEILALRKLETPPRSPAQASSYPAST